MKKNSILTVVFLATISLLGIIITQYWWSKNLQYLHEDQQNFEERQFNDRVVLALNEVKESIKTIRKDSALLLPIKQVSSNYFIANINDTLHPYLLESLLIREFKKRNIKENFEYGIYDCFTDSIVYGNFVDFVEDGSSAKIQDPPPIRWDQDGHYFGVYFPNRKSQFIGESNPWLFSSIVVVLVIIFQVYSIYIMLQQKKLSAIKTDFINNMTHELKTPISTISLSSEVLKQPSIINTPERLFKYAEIIYQENNRLKNLVDRVLQIASIDHNKINLQLATIDIHDILQAVIKNFELTIKQKNGSIEFLPEATEHLLLADSFHLTNILNNLLDNANKYTTETPKIVVNTYNKNRGICISIKDNGLGMSKEQIKNIFEKFYRVPTGNVHNIKGFGLGLYYVKTLTQAHGGKIDVTSTIGKGSEFELFLPINKALQKSIA